jgi:hypothetical protein
MRSISTILSSFYQAAGSHGTAHSSSLSCSWREVAGFISLIDECRSKCPAIWRMLIHSVTDERIRIYVNHVGRLAADHRQR